MKVLIVHAHYEPQSFNTALKDLAVDTLTAAGHQVVVSDLHAMNWNPVASAEDFGSRSNPDYCVYALEQRHGFETGTLSEEIRAEIGKVEWCDLLILNFPMFWFSMPAILKGWIDRVFVSGRFYGGRRIYDRGGMVGKKAMLCVTLGGRRQMFGAGSIHGEMEALLRPIQQGALAYCGFAVLPPNIAYHVPYVSGEERARMLADYRECLLGLDRAKPLRFPSMDDFDDKLQPKVRQ